MRAHGDHGSVQADAGAPCAPQRAGQQLPPIIIRVPGSAGDLGVVKETIRATDLLARPTPPSSIPGTALWEVHLIHFF